MATSHTTVRPFLARPFRPGGAVRVEAKTRRTEANRESLLFEPGASDASDGGQVRPLFVSQGSRCLVKPREALKKRGESRES